MRYDQFAKAQQLGRALMLPIALLPIAGLLLRIGQPDLLNLKIISQAGAAVFDNLPLLFAIGVAVGFARDGSGIAGLAGGLGYLVMMAVLKSSSDKLDPGVLAGIIIGISAAALYNRYKDIQLPSYLAFFGGKRFVPIATGLAALAIGLILTVTWPAIQRGIDGVGHWLLGAGAIGLFLYGVLNRLLLVTGLHHILNNLVWFIFGNYEAAGRVVHGDLNRFFAGDAQAGAFMTGFFPIMMFGLPAACLGMYRAAPPENRKSTGGILLSMAFTSFLTGITEPVEFTFLFLAPGLFALHAVLTGISMALMNALHVRLGFTFSAGAFDYALSYGLSSKGWMLVPVGLGYFGIYYAVFLFAIRRFKLATPGREAPVQEIEGRTSTFHVSDGVGNTAAPLTGEPRSRAYLEALGGADNLLSVEACMTRLRLSVRDGNGIDEAALKRLGVKGVLRLGVGVVQVVVGLEADLVAEGIRGLLAKAPAGPRQEDKLQLEAWLRSLGGEQNVKSIEALGETRLRIEVGDATRVDEGALGKLGARRLVRFSSTLVHVLCTGPGDLAAALRERGIAHASVN